MNGIHDYDSKLHFDLICILFKFDSKYLLVRMQVDYVHREDEFGKAIDWPQLCLPAYLNWFYVAWLCEHQTKIHLFSDTAAV
jgi:hypothetical protein